MRVLGSLALVVCLAALSLSTTACRPRSLPGTSAGTFTVTATLTSNACAGGFDPDPLIQYVTDIRVEGETSYWHRGDTPVASGTYSADGHFHFVAGQDVQAYGADAGRGGAPGCAIRQIETIDGTLALGASDAGVSDGANALDAASAADGGPDAGVHSTGFTGTDTIQLSVAPGSDCSALFATNGGPFSSLPCVATYTMTAAAN